MKHFESFLAPQLKDYITYRQNLGYATKTSLSQLRTFDRYLKNQKSDRGLLQPSFFLQLRSDLRIEPRSVNRILSSVRVFFQFLIRQGLYEENPLKDIPSLREHAIIPFVFSPAEIDRLLSEICKKIRKTPRYYLKDLSVYLAIVLIARCGLRISEPLRLKLSHYRHDERTIYIEKTKFKKDRLIPIPERVTMEIENYLAVRNSLLYDDQNPYLLAGNKQNKLSDNRVRFVFHQVVKKIGLDQTRQVIGNINFSSPTPHSLRHSFAINTLKRIKQQGRSPQNALPVLAAYMGHSEYKHTIKYLKVLDAEQRQAMFDLARSHQEEI